MREERICRTVFLCRIAAAVLLFCAAVGLCVYATVWLPKNIDGQAGGAGAFAAALGAGLALAAVIAVIYLICAVLTVVLLCAAVFSVKEHKYSPLNAEGGSRKRHLGYRIAADALFVIAAAALLAIGIPFGAAALCPVLVAAFGAACAAAAEAVQTVAIRRKGREGAQQ